MNRGKKKKLKVEARLVQDAVVQAIEKALKDMAQGEEDEETGDTEMC